VFVSMFVCVPSSTIIKGFLSRAVDSYMKINVKFPLYLTKYHVMNTYGEVMVQFHVFLISALDVGKQSASSPVHFTPWRKTYL
jgi:hypothetical protein